MARARRRARSANNAPVMNVDIGGGTSKIAVCADGKVVDLTAVDVGARLVCVDAEGSIVRHRGSRPALRRRAWASSSNSACSFPPSRRAALAARMADRLFEAMQGGSPRAGGADLLRLDPLELARHDVRRDVFRRRLGIHLRPRGQGFGDLGPQLAAGSARAAATAGDRNSSAPERAHPRHRDRRLAIHHAGVSGSTIFVSPLETLPLRNVPVIAPTLRARRRGDRFRRGRPPRSRARCGGSTSATAKRPVAVFVPWRGSATFRRLDAFCKGVVDGLAAVLARGHPIVLAGDGDVGGLIGIHCCEEMKFDNADRLDRRAGAEGVRLHRHRRDARHLGRRAGRDQVADLPDQRRIGQGLAGRARAAGRRGDLTVRRIRLPRLHRALSFVNCKSAG